MNTALPAGTGVEALQAICTVAGVEASATQVLALQSYLQMLQRWNATYNLTAVRDPREMLTQHLADCVAAVPPLRQHAAQARLLDVGSGGGLPAVVIAALLPGWSVTSVDAVGKKMAFVRQVAGTLPLANLQAVHTRIETLRAAPFDVITSRAFASLADFFTLTERHLAPGGVWMAMKGKVPDAEMAALPAHVEVFHVEHLSVPSLNADRCLVWMRKRN